MHKIILALVMGCLSMPVLSEVVFSDPTDPAGKPFQPVQQAQGEQGLLLQSVLVSEGRQVCIINGQMLSVGDDIQRYQVVEITDDKVILANQSGEDQVLYLHNIPEKNLNMKEVDDNDA